MSRAIDGVAQGAQEQASAISKSSTSTAQLSSAIQQGSEIVQEVSHESTTASETAISVVQTVQETIYGIQAIKETVDLSAQKVQEMGARSNQIGAIVDTIDDIASQTNMLALNAAIEADRAGEYGKGFAVVADEVRRLAERSSSATKEINELIKNIQNTITEAVSAMNKGTQEVEMGVSRANTAGEALNVILQAVERVGQQANLATSEALECEDPKVMFMLTSSRTLQTTKNCGSLSETSKLSAGESLLIARQRANVGNIMK